MHFFIYHFWYTSKFKTTYRKPPFIKAAIFFWCSFSIRLSGCKGEAIKLIPYYMKDIIYKTVKPSQLKKLQIIQNIKFQVMSIYFDWILINQIIVFSVPFCCWGKQIFEIMLPGGWEWVVLFCLGRDDKNLEASFWVGRGMSKNASNQCIF